MKKIKVKFLLLPILILLVFGLGIVVGRYQVFPYEIFDSANAFLANAPAPDEVKTKKLQMKKKIQNSNFKKQASVQRILREKYRLSKEWRVQLFEIFAPKTDVVFVGDSITDSGEWSDFFPLQRVANRGVSGDTTHDVLLRLGSIDLLEPKVVFIMIGINDIYINKSLEEIANNYRSIIEHFRSDGVRVIIQSTIQCYLPYCTEDKVKKVNKLNSVLEEIADSKFIEFVHLGELSDKHGLKEYYTYDGIHLNGNGYKKWVKSIAEIVESVQ